MLATELENIKTAKSTQPQINIRRIATEQQLEHHKKIQNMIYITNGKKN